MFLKRFVKFLLLLVLSSECNAQDSILVEKLFQNLLNKQVLNDSFFIPGTFPSYRQYSNSKQLKEDNNIFFSALIAFTLQELKPKLTQIEATVVDSICNRIKNSYSSFKNIKGRNTYNFWPIVDGQKTFFPNQGWLSKKAESLSLPDDMDDTGLILSSLDHKDSIAFEVHQLMQQYVNGNLNSIKNTLTPYKKIRAYSTWFGEKMPIDFDLGVHCNTLYFVLKHNLKLTKHDSATIQLVAEQIKNKHHLTKSNFISPYYYSTTNLLYHVVRLMSKFNIPQLEELKPQIILELQDGLKKEDLLINKILLATSLLKLGENPEKITLPMVVANGSLNNTDFVFYKGHLFGHLNNIIKTIASSTNKTQFNWFCSAFNDCLLLEYLILKRGLN